MGIVPTRDLNSTIQSSVNRSTVREVAIRRFEFRCVARGEPIRLTNAYVWIKEQMYLLDVSDFDRSSSSSKMLEASDN